MTNDHRQEGPLPECFLIRTDRLMTVLGLVGLDIDQAARLADVPPISLRAANAHGYAPAEMLAKIARALDVPEVALTGVRFGLCPFDQLEFFSHEKPASEQQPCDATAEARRCCGIGEYPVGREQDIK
jgi:hypothetical protein